jgi:hypothetical protein
MRELDHELRRLLSRKEPPDGFAERVLRRAQPAEQRSALPAPRRHFVRWAMAAALVAAVTGGMEYRERRQRAAGEAARAQVVQALQIAGSKLQLVQTKLNRLHEPSRNQ